MAVDELITTLANLFPEWIRTYGLVIGCILGSIPGILGAVPELNKMRQTRKGVGATVVHWIDCLAGATWMLAVWLAVGIVTTYMVGSFAIGLWPYSLIVGGVLIGLAGIAYYFHIKGPR